MIGAAVGAAVVGAPVGAVGADVGVEDGTCVGALVVGAEVGAAVGTQTQGAVSSCRFRNEQLRTICTFLLVLRFFGPVASGLSPQSSPSQKPPEFRGLTTRDDKIAPRPVVHENEEPHLENRVATDIPF